MRSGAARLLLVRHGESTWNSEGRWQGQADPPLSRDGERQARAAARVLAEAEVDAVWSSNLARASRTAAILAGSPQAVRAHPGLRERDVGAWTGLTRDDLDASHPGWSHDGWRPPGWEDDATLARRGRRALEEVAADLGAGRTAVVVSHGGLIRAVEAALGGAVRPMPHLAGLWLEAGADGLVAGPPVALLDAEPGLRPEADPVRGE